MLNKIISVIMSFAMSVTGFFYTSLNSVIDSASEMIFGIPYTAQAVKSDFFDDISDADVVTVDEDSGFVEDLVAVFIDGNIGFSEKLSFFAGCGGTLIGWSTPVDLYVLRYSPMTYKQVIAKCKTLEAMDGVALAIPVSAYKSTLNATPNDVFDTDEELVWDELSPDGSNWWLEAVQARQAWDYSDYFSKINIGVVDAGFDLDHPELDGKISFPSDRLANRNYEDVHGCHVAGIIGANKNNEVGIAGICDNSELICVDWTPELLQFWNTELAIFFGFSEVVKAGAKVVNFSLGTSGSRTDESVNFFDNLFSPAALSLMMASLLSKGYDFVAVQSAGNGDFFGDPLDASLNGHFSGINSSNIFTGFYSVSDDDILDRILVVASADNDGNGEYTQSYYSNVGSTVNIAAPGDNIYSCSSNGEYTYLSGTSMSAPVVTGIASLVWSVNPSFTGAQVKDIVCSSYDSIAKINTNVDYYYDVELYDYPMVNAKLAVEEAIRRTDGSVGTVSGKIIGAEAAEIVFDGIAHTVFSDGTYSFVASAGTDEVKIIDSIGNEIGSFELTVTAGQETSAPDYNTEEIPDEETTVTVPETTQVPVI